MHIGVIASVKKGLEQFIYREIRALARHGATISLFPTKHGPGLYDPRPEWNYYPWTIAAVLISQPQRFCSHPLLYLKVLATAIRYGAVVDFLLAAYYLPQFRNVDVIYATFGDRKLFVGYFAKRLLDKPLAVEIHAYELYGNPNPRLFTVALAACDQVVAATEHNLRMLRDRYGVDPEKIEVVRYTIDLDEYCPADKFVILIVGFFVEKKGHEILLKAVKQLDRADVEVWVVGGEGGSTSSPVDVERVATDLGISDRVAIFGKLRGTALRAVYHACDVFCLPCHFDRNGEGEGFPNVIIEAMACGKPVVTTRHVEIPQIVEQILVDENDVDALAYALEQVYLSSGLRDEMGRRNRELVEEHFCTDNVLETMRLLQGIAVPGIERGCLPTSMPEDSQLAITSAN